MRRCRSLCRVALALTLLGAAGATAEPALRTVARSGRAAPGFPEGVTFSEFRDAVIDERGHVAFVGAVTGPKGYIEHDTAMWLAGRRGSLRLVLREGAKLRGLPGATIDMLREAPILAPDGALFYRAALRSERDPGRGSAFLRATLGRRLRPLLWPDSPARDPGSLLGTISGARIGSGGVAFMAPDAPGLLDANTLYVWTGLESPRGLVRIGEEVPAPGRPVVWGLRWSAPGASGLPALVIETLRPNSGLHWSLQVPEADGRYVERARSNEPPPAGPAGSRFATIDESPWQNRNGDVAFKGRLTPGRTDAGLVDDILIWVLRSDGSAEVAARIADPAPGAPPGAIFGNFDLVDFSDSGAALIRAWIHGGGVTNRDNGGFWLHDPSSGLRRVFRNGDVLPCLPDHADAWSQGPATMNAGGTVVLPIESPDGDALVAFLPDGECVALVVQGDLVPLGRRRSEVVRDFEITGDGRFPERGGRLLNDAGELVFRARFEDGSEAVMLTAPIAPTAEPN